MLSGHIEIWLTEEYGYREWLWRPGMTAEEFEAYWTSMPCVGPHFMDPSKTLPGEFWEIYPARDESPFDKFGPDYTPPRTWVRVATDGTEDTYDRPDGPVWSGHIHEEDDSAIGTPDGRVLYHAGHPAKKVKA